MTGRTSPGASGAWRPSHPAHAWGALARVARRPAVAALTIVSLSVAVNVGFALWVRWPVPVIQDEFSYLLGADTLAHGRVASPTHVLWQHFEAPHVIPVPTYVSKYQPGQAIVLALGQVLTGYPIAGVWLSVVAACLAFFWMLRAWMPPRWALLGAWLAAVHPMTIEWGQTFWGGAVAACGGALLIGAWRRMWDDPSRRTGATLGVGLALLANSRPYEGLVLTVLLAFATLIQLWRRGQDPRRAIVVQILPSLAAVLAAAASLMLYYNHRTTGDAFRMPYVVHERMYSVAPLFLFQQPSPEPSYRHKEMRDLFVGYALATYREQQPPDGLWTGLGTKVRQLFDSFLLTPWVMISLPMWLLAGRRDPLVRALLSVGAICVLLFLPETWLWPHYVAPVVGLFLVLTMLGLRHLYAWRFHGRPVGAWCVLVYSLMSVFSIPTEARFLASEGSGSWHWATQRAALADRLRRAGGRHLVVVRYRPTHSAHREWVYNGADIDASPVVWAREMDMASNQRLLDYFRDRQAWLVEADEPEPHLTAYRQVPSAGPGNP